MPSSQPHPVIADRPRIVPQRLRRRRPAVSAASLLAVALALGLGLALFTAILARPNLLAWAERTAVDAGFGVASADIRGNRFTLERDIRAALALDGAKTQWTLDVPGMVGRLEALPWVKTASIRRILPYAIAVDITERTPAALWREAGNDRMIDAEGRILTVVGRGTETGLPLLVGPGAGPAAATILPLLAEHRAVASRLVEARRIAGRRWSLAVSGGTLVHLPGDGAAAAMAWLEKEATGGLLDRGLAVIDLRVHGQLVVGTTQENSARIGDVSQGAALTAAAAGPR